MENNKVPIITTTGSPEAQQDSPEPISTPSSKNSNKLLWTLGIMLVLAIAAAIIFAILYFTNPTSEQPATETPTSEEAEITNTYILRDLDEKISILHYTTETGSLIKKPGNGINYISTLYKEGDLSEIAKLAHLALSLKGDYVIDSDAQQSIISEQGYDYGNYIFDFKAIKGETIAAKYLDTFGKQLNKGAANGQRYCPEIFYNSTYDFYYENAACGGTGPYTVLIYKNKYTTDAEHAYVYVSVGTFNAEDNKVYCDIIDINNFAVSPPSVCAESVPTQNQATIDDTNYQDFTEYRFIFNQADNGTYYFAKAEKL